MNTWIVTTCRNEATEIVEHLKFLNRLEIKYGIRYAIVDGNSTDGTDDLIVANKSPSAVFIANGGTIYKSWNIALKTIFDQATHFLFLGVGDRITDDFACIIASENDCDVLCSSLRMSDKIYKAPTAEQIGRSISATCGCMPVHHAGSVFSRRLFESVGFFSESYLVAADLDWMLKLKCVSNVKIACPDLVGVEMRAGGVSTGRRAPFSLLFEEIAISLNNLRLPCIKRVLFLTLRIIKNTSPISLRARN